MSEDVRVSTTNNDSRRTLAVDVLEDTAHLQLRNEIGAAGEVVGGQQSSVVDTFDGEVSAVFAAELVTEGLANDGALESFPSQNLEGMHTILLFGGFFFKYPLTMLPASVDPRAHTKITSLHPPPIKEENSFSVKLVRSVTI